MTASCAWRTLARWDVTVSGAESQTAVRAEFTPGVLQRRRLESQRYWLVERQIEKLLEPQVGDLAIASSLNHERTLIVARHLRAQQLELRDVADVFRELSLLKDILRLRVRRLGDRIPGGRQVRRHNKPCVTSRIICAR